LPKNFWFCILLFLLPVFKWEEEISSLHRLTGDLINSQI
jgi:hypothetical protein